MFNLYFYSRVLESDEKKIKLTVVAGVVVMLFPVYFEFLQVHIYTLLTRPVGLDLLLVSF